jgi:hypothetical protein
VAEGTKRRQVTSRTAAEVKYAKRRRGANVPHERLDVLPYIVLARSFPILGRTLVVVRKRFRGNDLQVFLSLCHYDFFAPG